MTGAWRGMPSRCPPRWPITGTPRWTCPRALQATIEAATHAMAYAPAEALRHLERALEIGRRWRMPGSAPGWTWPR